MKSEENTPKRWMEFEKQVAALLQDFGYVVEHDTKVQGAQTDVFARSIHPKTPSLIVECKYHESPDAKVRIDEAENFIARVVNLRHAGEIDRGYLITNTDFTSDAKAALVGPHGKYVFLMTYNQFVAGLLNADSYMKGIVASYETNGMNERFVDLRVVDTTQADGTIFDAEIGAWDSDPDGHSISDEGAKVYRRWILPKEEIDRLVELGWASTVASFNHCRLHWPTFRAGLKQAEEAKVFAEKKHLQQVNRKHQQLVMVVKRAKRLYAEELARRLDRVGDAKVIELLAQKPPEFSKTLRELIAPQLPPLAARSIWERCLKAAKDMALEPRNAVALTDAPQAACITENSPAIAREESSVDLMLFPMQNGLQSLHSFLADPNKRLCVLLGDYGAGKSTLMQRLAWQLAQHKLASSTDPSVRIPLLLNLRDYNKVADFSRLVRSFLTDEADMGDLSLPMFRKLNSAGYFILLLDGFDEMLERVTKPDRRRCFLEIAQFLTPRSKVVISGRPGYFPDYQELSEVLAVMAQDPNSGEVVTTIPSVVLCLQLMDGHELEQFLNRSSTEVSVQAKSLIEANPNLHDLARRPVLTAMIMGSATELSALGKRQVSVRDLYDLYTNKWVQREEDKGKFRILMDPARKSTFVRYTAMRMHLTGNLTISFRDLGREIQKYFNLTNIDEVDYFSNDIRTCSFLNRSDDGQYRFIHKSFMEYFVAVEFERGEESPFAADFNKALVPEMIAFLSKDRSVRSSKNRAAIDQIIETVQALKELSIKNQDFDWGASCRDVERKLKKGYADATQYAYRSMLSHKSDGDAIMKVVKEISKSLPSEIPKWAEARYKKLLADAAALWSTLAD